MKRGVRRVVGAGVLLLCVGAPPAFADQESGKRGDEWPPKYESPLADLLFLPIRILIRLGSAFEPKEKGEDAERSGSGEPSPRQ